MTLSGPVGEVVELTALRPGVGQKEWTVVSERVTIGADGRAKLVIE